MRHPWALGAWSAACLTVALASTSPVYRAIVVVAAAAMLAGPLRPGASLRALAVAVAAAGVGAVLINFLLSHTGETIVVSAPAWLPLVGGPLTLESAAFGGATALGIAAAFLAVAPLGLVLEPDQLLDALPRHLERVGAALTMTLGMAPGLLRSRRAIHEAQVMRGWRPAGPRSWAEIVVPVALTAMEDSFQVAEAMEARAFGAGPRTRWQPLAWTWQDIVTAAVSAGVATAFVGAHVAGAATDWLTYPTLAPPPADPALVVASAALLVPGVLRWRS